MCRRFLFFYIISALFFMINDFFSSLSDFIFCPNRPEKSDIIIVPGSADITPLAQEAALLYKQWFGSKIIFTGSKNIFFHSSCPTEAECLRDIALWLWVPANDIILETRAKHTFQNALYTHKILAQRGIQISSAVLVCKWFHSRRALLSYQSVFWPKVHFTVRTISWSKNITANNWLQDEQGREVVLTEIEKIGNYLKKHMIQIEQGIDISSFQKHSHWFSRKNERLLYKDSSSEYFIAKRGMYNKNIPKNYSHIYIFSLESLFAPGFFRDFLKQLVTAKELGDVHSVGVIKNLTSHLIQADFQNLLKLWEAYVKASMRNDIDTTIKTLKSHKWFCILVWYTYDPFLQLVANLLGIHRVYGTHLEYSRDVCSGEVSIPSHFFDTNGVCSPFHVVHSLQHNLSDDDVFVIQPPSIFSMEGHSYQVVSQLSSLTQMYI